MAIAPFSANRALRLKSEGLSHLFEAFRPTDTRTIPPLAADGPPKEPPAHLSHATLVALALFYVGFAALYAGTIAYSVHLFQPHAFGDYLRRTLLYDYTLKAGLTVPVWWLLFRTPLDQALWRKQALAHALLGPAWVLAWFSGYYALLRALGEGGLRGPGRVWDLYIPALFYGVQFGVLHMVRFTQRLRYRTQLAHYLQAQAHHSATALLRAQINPHFLFNTLNSISASVPPALEPTRELIARLAQTFRFALDASRHPLIPLGDEIEFLEAYLSLEHARFGDRLTSVFRVDPALRACRVPPMLVQPLVENAVRHGISPSVAGGAVQVEVSVHSPHLLRVCVADTGIGWPAGRPLSVEQVGLGLHNTHNRLLALGSPGLVLQPRLPSGLQVSFLLPRFSSLLAG